jgi:hypothetical protein
VAHRSIDAPIGERSILLEKGPNDLEVDLNFYLPMNFYFQISNCNLVIQPIGRELIPH